MSFECLYAQSKYIFIQYHSAKYVGDKVSVSALQGYSVIIYIYTYRHANIYKSSSMQKLS